VRNYLAAYHTSSLRGSPRSLVLGVAHMAGFTRSSLTRASAVADCQSTLVWFIPVFLPCDFVDFRLLVGEPPIEVLA
jgi:hypothetical protein